MQRLTSCASALLLGACSFLSEAEPVAPPPDYCQLTEHRKFGFDEFDWRSENSPGNLRYQILSNELRAEVCPEESP